MPSTIQTISILQWNRSSFFRCKMVLDLTPSFPCGEWEAICEPGARHFTLTVLLSMDRKLFDLLRRCWWLSVYIYIFFKCCCILPRTFEPLLQCIPYTLNWDIFHCGWISELCAGLGTELSAEDHWSVTPFSEAGTGNPNQMNCTHWTKLLLKSITVPTCYFNHFFT